MVRLLVYATRAKDASRGRKIPMDAAERQRALRNHESSHPSRPIVRIALLDTV